MIIILIVLAVLILGAAGSLFCWFHVGEPAKGYYEAAMQGHREKTSRIYHKRRNQKGCKERLCLQLRFEEKKKIER